MEERILFETARLRVRMATLGDTEALFALILARVFAENVRSRRLLQRMGFVLEGCLRHAVKTPDGVVQDDCLFSMLREEYILLNGTAKNREKQTGSRM